MDFAGFEVIAHEVPDGFDADGLVSLGGDAGEAELLDFLGEVC